MSTIFKKQLTKVTVICILEDVPIKKQLTCLEILTRDLKPKNPLPWFERLFSNHLSLLKQCIFSFDILTEALVRFLIQSKFHGGSKNPPRLVEREFLFHFSIFLSTDSTNTDFAMVPYLKNNIQYFTLI